MSPLSVQVPFPVFQGRDGQPLENGYIWIGEPNLNPQTNPVVAYFDAALTIPAPQPLRTLNGYVSRAGTPAQVYVDGVNFSILVQDSKGSMVYNFPDGTGISPDACGVTYDPPFTGGVPYPVCEKLAQTVSLTDFGAVGDGTTDDTAAFNALALEITSQVVNLTGKTYYIADENLLEDFDGIVFVGPGTLKFGKVLGENTYTVPTTPPKFTNCEFHSVTFSAPTALGYAVFSRGSDNIKFVGCTISDVKPHFVQGVETNFWFTSCNFIAPDTAPGTCLQTIGNVIEGMWVDSCEWEFAPNQGAGVLVAATNDNRLKGNYWVTNNKVFTSNTSGYCLDTFVDLEPDLDATNLTSVHVLNNTVYNAKLWVSSCNLLNVSDNYVRMTSVAGDAASGFPITIGNAYGTAGCDVINIVGNSVICDTVAIEETKCPIGMTGSPARINTLNIKNNRLQANGALINTDPASVISLVGIDIGNIVIEGNTLSYSSVPPTLFPAINIITQAGAGGTGTYETLVVRGNTMYGPASSYNYFLRDQNGGSATTIGLIEVVDNDVSECAPTVAMVSYSSNTVTRKLVGENPGYFYPNFTPPTFTNSWVDEDNATYYGAGYRLCKNTVQLQGTVSGGGMTQSAFTLPTYLRPSKQCNLPVFSYNSGGTVVFGRVQINTDGTFVIANGDNNFVSLDGLEFSL